MAGEKIRHAIQDARQYLSEHPAEARYTDGPATAVLEADLRCRVRGVNTELAVTDMPSSVGGDGSAPSAGWLFRAAQASCLATLIAMRAAEQQVALSRLEVTVDSESDDRGILGMDESVPAGPLSGRARVVIASETTDEEQLHLLVDWADRHCPVTDALRRPVPLRVEVHTEGRLASRSRAE